MSSGIITVSFGKDFDRLSALAWKKSREFTSLPIHVLTNIKDSERSPVWGDVPNVTFKVFDLPQNENRKAKLTMNEHTPFSKSLYLDADSVIQRFGAEDFEAFFGEKDLILCYNKTYEAGRKLPRIYANAMRKYGVSLPARVYYGAIIAFKKTEKVDFFFKHWYKLWEGLNSGREMPALCCTVNKYDIDKGKFPKGWFSGTKRNPHSVVQHDYGSDFRKRFGFPKWAEATKLPYDSKKVYL